jgi:hypothetical protein
MGSDQIFIGTFFGLNSHEENGRFFERFRIALASFITQCAVK